ncbi:MAG TPA: cupin domain-containing protein [Myxococcota bacterium]
MRAFFRESPNEKIDGNVLEANGVFYRQLPMEKDQYQPHLDDLTKKRGYITQDEVKLWPDMPNLEVALKKFDPEHHHEEDEVRFVLDGEGVFDIRSNDERWMRVIVEKGDLIVVPKGKHHRFELTEQTQIHCVRLFKDPAGWVAVYRNA